MTPRLALVLLATVIAAPAAADVAPRQPVAPIFEIDKVDSRADIPQQTVKLWRTGAWTFEETTKGKTTASANGTLTDVQLKQARVDLGAATWKTTSGIHCMARGTASTLYKVDGKQVWAAMMCAPTKLDATSQASLDDLQKLLAVAWPADTGSGSGKGTRPAPEVPENPGN